MTIYKVTIEAFRYIGIPVCREDFLKTDKYFSTVEKAVDWINNHPKFIISGYDKNHTEARNEKEMPKFISMTPIKLDE